MNAKRMTLIATALLGCGTTTPAPQPESSEAPSASGSPTRPSASSPASAIPAPAPSASATASAATSASSSPGLPSGVTECEKASGHFAGFTPSVEELALAARALEADGCIPRSNLEQAIRACAAQVGGTALNISADDFNGPKGCSLRIAGGASQGRKWVVFAAYFRSGATFYGGSTAVELGPPPRVYVDALGKHAELCPLTGGSGTMAAGSPDGWSALPADVKDFLCSGPSVPR